MRVGVGGLLIGRGPECDWIVLGTGVSRAHALVRMGTEGPQILVLGGQAGTVNGQRFEHAADLPDGADVEIAGVVFHVRYKPAPRHVHWALQLDNGPLLGVARAPLSMGGGDNDRVLVEGLPPRAVRFSVVAGALFLDTQVPVEVDGEAWTESTVMPVSPGSVIVVGGQRLRVRAAVPSGGATTPMPEDEPARAAYFEFMPVGGRLTLTFADRPVSVELSELHARLVAVLLSPPEGHTPGEFIPDEVILGKIWPRQAKQRTDLNTLVHRLRRSLLRHRLHPAAVLERAAQGGALRLRLAKSADVRVA